MQDKSEKVREAVGIISAVVGVIRIIVSSVKEYKAQKKENLPIIK